MRSVLLFVFVAGCSGTESTTPSLTDSGAEDTHNTVVDTGAAAADTGSAADTLTDPWDGGAPSAECVAHCECMKTTCATYASYPYTLDKDCTAHCGRFTAPEMKCWTYWCTEAKKATGSSKQHLCQHAWGTWGLEECPK
jgi:hypothetical protein